MTPSAAGKPQIAHLVWSLIERFHTFKAFLHGKNFEKGGGRRGRGWGEKVDFCMFETLLYGNAKSCLRDGNVCVREGGGVVNGVE